MSDNINKKVEEMEKCLNVLADERGIQQTINAYAHTIDYGLKEQFADLFTEDAIYDVQMRGKSLPQLPGGPQPPGGLRGRPAILNYVKAHPMIPDVWQKHFLVDLVIRLEGDGKASAESYFTRLTENDKGPVLPVFGRYRDQLVKSPDGKWRFKKRVCEIESISR